MSFIYNNPILSLPCISVWQLFDEVQRGKVAAAPCVKHMCLYWLHILTEWQSTVSSLFVATSVSRCNTSRPQKQPSSLLLLLSYADTLLSHITPAPTPWLLHMLWKEQHKNSNTIAHADMCAHTCHGEGKIRYN